MPGLIGNLFTPDQDAVDEDSTDVAIGGGTELDLSPSIELNTGGSYNESSGATTTWSNTTVIDVNVGAQVDHATSFMLDDL